MSDAAPNQTNTLVAVQLVIIDEDPKQPKVVGQRITLRVRASGSLAKIRWTIPGAPVAGFEVDVSGSKLTTLKTTDTDRVEFYWTFGGEHRVRVDAEVDGLNGSAEQLFGVKAPADVSFKCTIDDAVTIAEPTKPEDKERTKYAARYLRCGKWDAESPGIDWSFRATGPAGFHGELMAVQLTTLDITWKDFQPGRQYGGTHTKGNQFLDCDPNEPRKEISYGRQQKRVSPGAPESLQGSDSPGVQLEPDPTNPQTRVSPYLAEASTSQRFWLYLLYRPAGPGSIWVPVRRVHWRWNGIASRTSMSAAWQARAIVGDPNPPIAAPTAEVTAEYPVWAGHILTFGEEAIELEEGRR